MPEFQYKSPAAWFSALVLSMPVTAIIWFVVVYPVYGLTGTALHTYFHGLTALTFYLFIFGWAIYGSDKTSEVIYRICRFGMILALLLPISTGFVSIVWVSGVVGRPDGFLAGYSALEIPVYAATASLVLIILCLAGSYLAARDMEGIPF